MSKIEDKIIEEYRIVTYNQNRQISLLNQQNEQLKSENAKFENASRIVQAELKRQYDRVDALAAENKLISERVNEQNNIIDSWKKQYQILCDKHYANMDELKQIRKAYFELKADHESVHVIVRCGRCK